MLTQVLPFIVTHPLLSGLAVAGMFAYTWRGKNDTVRAIALVAGGLVSVALVWRYIFRIWPLAFRLGAMSGLLETNGQYFLPVIFILLVSILLGFACLRGFFTSISKGWGTEVLGTGLGLFLAAWILVVIGGAFLTATLNPMGAMQELAQYRGY